MARPPQRRALLLDELLFRTVFRRPDKGKIGQFFVFKWHMESVPEDLQGIQIHFFHIVGYHVRLASLSHAESLDRFHQDHGRLTFVPTGRGKGSVNLSRVMTAPAQLPEIPIAHTIDQGCQVGIVPEYLFLQVVGAAGVDGLEVTVDHGTELLQQQPLFVPLQDRIPLTAPDQLYYIPTRAPEPAFQLLNNLAVATHRTIEPL